MNNPLGFEFAKKLRDPAFRARLHEVGWASGTAVYPVGYGETPSSVKARMVPGRHLLVMADDDAPFEMRMLMIEVDT